MYYQDKTIGAATADELLFVLLHKHGLHPAPTRVSREDTAQSCLVPIGDDNTAEIVIFNDDLGVLKQRIAAASAEAGAGRK